MKQRTFRAIIQQSPGMNAAYVECPFDAEAFFGKKRIPVRACFDGKANYTGSLVRMSGNCHVLGLTQAIRKELGKTFGDEIEVQLTEDLGERIVEIPDDVRNYFVENPQAGHVFDTWSYTRKKECIRAIESAKKPETREKRKQKLFNDLS